MKWNCPACGDATSCDATMLLQRVNRSLASLCTDCMADYTQAIRQGYAVPACVVRKSNGLRWIAAKITRRQSGTTVVSSGSAVPVARAVRFQVGEMLVLDEGGDQPPEELVVQSITEDTIVFRSNSPGGPSATARAVAQRWEQLGRPERMVVRSQQRHGKTEALRREAQSARARERLSGVSARFVIDDPVRSTELANEPAALTGPIGTNASAMNWSGAVGGSTSGQGNRAERRKAQRYGGSR